jgi:hypothetical protein
MYNDYDRSSSDCQDEIKLVTEPCDGAPSNVDNSISVAMKTL